MKLAGLLLLAFLSCCRLSLEGMADACFNNAVGVADPGIIPDYQINASSWYYSRYLSYSPYYGRVNETRGYGWCASSCCNNQDWLQVDLGRAIKVCGVATQGCWALNSYAVVTDFKLSYSFHRNVWTTYLDTKSTAKHFHRKANSSIVVQHSLPVPISARYIRFHPTNQYHWNCLRVEVYGTALTPTTSGATQSTTAVTSFSMPTTLNFTQVPMMLVLLNSVLAMIFIK